MEASYTSEELERVKKAELMILKKAIECCKELNIPYFLAYGTALGAVRHGGFIPWDDDIDIGLTRKNYERFLKEAPDWFKGKGMFVEHISTEPTCPYAFAKIRMDNTLFVEYCNRNVKMHHGVYVDVFPFDELPASVEAQKIQYDKAQKIHKKYVYRQTPDITVEPTTAKLKIKQFVRRLIHYISHVNSPEKIYDELTSVMTQYNGSNSGVYGCLFYPKFKAGCMTYEMVTELKEIKFEDVVASVPKDVEEYLASQYGNYMELPPVEHRTGHRPYKVII